MHIEYMDPAFWNEAHVVAETIALACAAIYFIYKTWIGGESPGLALSVTVERFRKRNAGATSDFDRALVIATIRKGDKTGVRLHGIAGRVIPFGEEPSIQDEPAAKLPSRHFRFDVGRRDIEEASNGKSASFSWRPLDEAESETGNLFLSPGDEMSFAHECILPSAQPCTIEIVAYATAGFLSRFRWRVGTVMQWHATAVSSPLPPVDGARP